ncbi:unnamed protein product [Urochloa decumbens]|uniref:F-box domain-containing protein n=1 Tax=Urochloa decumbens TaxID=240449 RepID=A0ABC9B8P3_9POAL
MSAAKSHKGTLAAAPASGGDRIGALPDEILHRVLSFLPARQAVQTCVLARRWLPLWKHATGLRIVGADGKAPVPFEEARELVDSLVILREASPLETFELKVAGAVIDVRRMRLWVRYALQHEVQELQLNIDGRTPTWVWPDVPPLASTNLICLELHGLVFNHEFLDFSRCPTLQHLKIEDCSFMHAERISSQSLKHLIIQRGRFNHSSRTRIHLPNLASLSLDVTDGRAPALERMPMLVSASVWIHPKCVDCCSHSNDGDCGNESCGGCIKDDKSPLILGGISQAKTLKLAAHDKMFIFRRDLKGCPTFSRLKSLALNEHWCVPDVRGLACILQHSPIVEELRLLVFYKLQGHNVKMIGRFDPKELPPTISACLKRVEVRCGEVDGRIVEVLKFLSKFNISFSFSEYRSLKAGENQSSTT